MIAGFFLGIVVCSGFGGLALLLGLFAQDRTMIGVGFMLLLGGAWFAALYYLATRRPWRHLLPRYKAELLEEEVQREKRRAERSGLGPMARHAAQWLGKDGVLHDASLRVEVAGEIVRILHDEKLVFEAAYRYSSGGTYKKPDRIVPSRIAKGEFEIHDGGEGSYDGGAWWNINRYVRGAWEEQLLSLEGRAKDAEQRHNVSRKAQKEVDRIRGAQDFLGRDDPR